MKLWQRLLGIAACIGGFYLLWRFPPAGIGVVLLGASAAFLGRNIHRSKLTPNPIGEKRDYALRPVVVALVKCFSSFAAAIIWCVPGVYVVKRGYLPDTDFGVGLALGPALVFLAASAFYLFKAIFRFNFGGQPPVR